MEERNFMEDPEQYFDKLPQPFNFLHKLVYRILDSAWDEFLLSQKLRHEHSGLNKLSVSCAAQTDIPEDMAYVDLVPTNIHSEEETVDSTTMLVLANRTHLLYFPASCAYQTQDPLFQHKLPIESPLKQLCLIVSSDKYSFIVGYDVQQHVQYYAITAQESYLICSIPEAESVKVTAVAEDDSYIILTCSDGEDTFLILFNFPSTQWTETVHNILSLEEEELGTNRQLPTFTKPSLMAKIIKPLPLRPTNLFGTMDTSALTDPKAYFNGMGHTLSHEFFRNQYNAFAETSKFDPTLITPTSVRLPLFSPHFHTVVAESPGRKDLALWWEGSNELLLYSFSTPPKDPNVYPITHMTLATRILSSCASTLGHVLVLAFHDCLSIWKFPHRYLIKFLNVGEDVDVSSIKFFPSLEFSGYKEQFLCIAGGKCYSIMLDSYKTKLTPLNQTDEPVLPPVVDAQELFQSPTTHLIMFSHAGGVRSVRDLAASSPALLTILQSDTDSKLEGISSHLSVEDRQLYLVPGGSHSPGRMLLQYDLSQMIGRIKVHKIGIEHPTPTPEELRKPIFCVEGDNSIKKLVLDVLNEVYMNREATWSKADEVWKEMDNFFK